MIKKLIAVASLFAVVACTRVEPGYVGIKVNMLGQQRGVEDIPIVAGRVYYNPFTTEVFEFPTYVQRVIWTENNNQEILFNSVEGAAMSVDVGIAVKFDGTKVPSLFLEFRQDADVLVDGWVRDRVRDSMNAAASTRKAVNIISNEKEAFMADVNKRVQAELAPHGIILDQVSLLGKFRVDQRIDEAINAVIATTQKTIEAQNRVLQSQAEADQVAAQADGERRKLEAEATGRAAAVLVEAEAQAKANNLVAKSLTPELVQWRSIEKWNGTLPTFSGGGAVPFINLEGMKK